MEYCKRGKNKIQRTSDQTNINKSITANFTVLNIENVNFQLHFNMIEYLSSYAFHLSSFN